MTRQRRHPAQASRILAAGLSAATMLGIVAVLGATGSAGAPDGSTDLAPAKVAVTVRVPARDATGRPAQLPQAGRPPDTSTHPS
jgi:hypothetical protein